MRRHSLHIDVQHIDVKIGEHHKIAGGKDLDWSAVGLGTPHGHGWVLLNQRVDTCYMIPFPSGALASTYISINTIQQRPLLHYKAEYYHESNENYDLFHTPYPYHSILIISFVNPKVHHE